MADNYLEKRMEEYRAGKLTSKGGRLMWPGSVRPEEYVGLSANECACALRDAALVSRVLRCFRKSGFPGGFL